jgi:hypothetical protein
MAEEQVSGGGLVSESGPVCPWCSAALPSETEERCPSCGAALHEAATSEVPGVTRIDHEALLKGRAPTQKPRGIIGWLSGEYEAPDTEATPHETLEPPDDAVRREMLRLELAALEAEVLARQAEAVAEVAAETGEPVDLEDLGLAAPNKDIDASTDGSSGPEGAAAAVAPDAEDEGDAADAPDEAAAAAGVASDAEDETTGEARPA